MKPQVRRHGRRILQVTGSGMIEPRLQADRAGRQVILYLSRQRRRKGAPASPGSYMILPRRQQAILDQMERALGAADSQLRSSYAAFARRAEGAPFPAAEVIATRPVRFLVLGLVILLALGFLAFGISDVSGGCPSAVWHGVCAATSGRA
jgi:hypothetical protein